MKVSASIDIFTFFYMSIPSYFAVHFVDRFAKYLIPTVVSTGCTGGAVIKARETCAGGLRVEFHV